MIRPNNGFYTDAQGNDRNIVETVTGAVKEINSDHAAIHYGYGMEMHLYLASLAGAAVKLYRFKGPTTLFAHIKNLQVIAQGAPLRIELLRGVTITNVGTLVSAAIGNMNDNSDVVPESAVYDGPVAFTGGTVWTSLVLPGSTSAPGAVSGGSIVKNDNLEFITKDADTSYIIRVTNLSASDAAQFLNVNMFFYEEPTGVVE